MTGQHIFALVDCNNFYVSCERVFAPWLNKQPVIVLSNNDGCIIARSNEVKSLGIAMGTPFFKCQALIKKHRIHVFSSNYALYGDISQRVMQTLGVFTPEIEIYSIDEAFLRFPRSKDQALNYDLLGRQIKKLVYQWTAIPVSVGFGPTKTLAKLASTLAKKNGQGVMTLAEHNIDYFLGKTRVEDIWGIGKKSSTWLHAQGIDTALQLKNMPLDWIHGHLKITGLQTVLELQAQPCLDLKQRATNKSIRYARSFASEISDKEQLVNILCQFINQGASKLRRQSSVAHMLSLTLKSGEFVRAKHFYQILHTKTLYPPTDLTGELLKAGRILLEQAYLPGIGYKKAGIILSGLERKGHRQLTFKDLKSKNRTTDSPPQRHSTAPQNKQRPLMKVMDTINDRYGRHCLQLGSIRQDISRQEHRSPAYTRDWQQLPLVH